jgi:hypothetical protein
MIAVSNRLGHANPVITMMIYAHVDKQVDRGLLTRDELGLPPRDRNAEHDHHDDTSCTDRGTLIESRAHARSLSSTPPTHLRV